MIAALMFVVRLFGMSAANPLLLLIPVVGLSGLAGWHVLHERGERKAEVLAAYAEGVQAERKVWEDNVRREVARQKEVGDKALADAKLEIKRLEDENLALAANSKEWDREADSAADSGEWCISVDSMQRLNRSR